MKKENGKKEEVTGRLNAAMDSRENCDSRPYNVVADKKLITDKNIENEIRKAVRKAYSVGYDTGYDTGLNKGDRDNDPDVVESIITETAGKIGRFFDELWNDLVDWVNDRFNEAKKKLEDMFGGWWPPF